jgi:hypothetical protein
MNEAIASLLAPASHASVAMAVALSVANSVAMAPTLTHQPRVNGEENEYGFSQAHP